MTPRSNATKWSVTCSLVTLCLVAPTITSADPIVPASLAAVEGSSNNGFPFNLVAHGVPSMRYQQVYEASEFGTQPILIRGFLLRPDAVFGTAFSATLPRIEVSISTTPRGPATLSPFFASNIGVDIAPVFKGSLSMSSANTDGPGGTRAFDIAVPFSSPFRYNPRLGNLLLDVRNFSATTTTQFDAVDERDSVARAWSRDVNASVAASVDTGGLVTRFESTATPEPGTMMLLSTAVLTSIARRHSQRRRARPNKNRSI